MVTALAVLPANAGTADDAAAQRSITVSTSADTTYSQVAQDGDTRGLTTLATCPQTCEKNQVGERQAVLSFAVTGLPADAGNITAALQLHAWNPVDASVTAHPANGGAEGSGAWAQRPTLGAALDSRPEVVSGYNSWDVSAAVRGNGAVTLALRQADLENRIYWASRENKDPTLAPRLTISYDAGAAPSWALVWSDEFNGQTLDTKRWNARTNSWVDYDLACITNRPQNVSVGGGLLTLRAQRERYTCGGGGTRSYTTAYLATDGGRASFKYGRFEIRAKSPTGPLNSQGLWPAFWMRPDGGGKGEIDVVELPGGAKYHKAATQAIFYDYTPVKQDHRYAFPTGRPADGFHRYSLDWDPKTIRWYIDGVQVWQRDRASTPWFDEVFHKAYHLRLNFQVGGWLGNPDASTAFPAEFQVDYVRVFQRTNPA